MSLACANMFDATGCRARVHLDTCSMLRSSPMVLLAGVDCASSMDFCTKHTGTIDAIDGVWNLLKAAIPEQLISKAPQTSELNTTRGAGKTKKLAIV